MNPTINDSPANKQRGLDDRTIIQPDIKARATSIEKQHAVSIAW